MFLKVRICYFLILLSICLICLLLILLLKFSFLFIYLLSLCFIAFDYTNIQLFFELQYILTFFFQDNLK